MSDVLTRLGVALHHLLSSAVVDDKARGDIQGLANELMAFESKDAADDVTTGKRLADLEAAVENVGLLRGDTETLTARVAVAEAAVAALQAGIEAFTAQIEAAVAPGADTVAAPAGDDILTGDAGSDTITGDQGADSVSGTESPAAVDGGPGADVTDSAPPAEPTEAPSDAPPAPGEAVPADAPATDVSGADTTSGTDAASA